MKCGGTLDRSNDYREALVGQPGVPIPTLHRAHEIFGYLPEDVDACGLAPVMMVGHDVYGRLSPAKIPAILDRYRRRGPEYG